MSLRIRLFGLSLVMLGHLGLVGMQYLDNSVSLQQVIATKNADQIRQKVISLWPEGLCTVYLWLDESDKGKPVLQAVGAVGSAEVGRDKIIDIRQRQAQYLKDYLLLDVVYPALGGKIYAQDAFKILDTLAGSGASGLYGIFGEATSQNARDAVFIIKSLIYNYAPKIFDTHYDEFFTVYAKKTCAYILYQDSSSRMKNFQRGIYQDFLRAQRSAVVVDNLSRKSILGKKWVLGAGAVLCVVAGYTYTQFALDRGEQKLKHGETESEVDVQETTSNV